MYPNEVSVFTMPNQKKDKDYYENPSLPHLTDEH